MQIRCSQLYHVLSKTHDLAIAGDPPLVDPSLKRARAWRRQHIEPETLYLVDATDGKFRDSTHWMRILGSADAVLLCGDASGEALGAYAASARGEQRVVMACSGSTVDMIMEEVSDILLDLERWDCALKEATLSTYSLERLFALGEEAMPELLGMTDPDLNVIIDSQKPYRAELRRTVTQGGSGRLRIANSEAEELLLEDDYPQAAQEKGVFVYPKDPAKARYICGNVFAGHEYCARLTADCPSGLDLFALQGLTNLFGHFLHYMRLGFLRERQDEQGSEPHNASRRTLRQILEDSSGVTPEQLLSIADDCDWPAEGAFLVVRARFIEGAYWSDMANFLCAELEQAEPGSRAAASGSEIIWVCSLARSQHVDDAPFFEKLGYLVREHTCKMGVSRHLEGIERILLGSREAQIALDLGQRHDPHFWYYRFSDYLPPYLLEQMTHELPVDQLAHPGIKRLLEFDAEHGTDYLQTLRLYFDSGYNVAKAAQESYVHRTTFSRRLDRIKSIAGFNPRDPRTRLDLIISFWMMDTATAPNKAP